MSTVYHETTVVILREYALTKFTHSWNPITEIYASGVLATLHKLETGANKRKLIYLDKDMARAKPTYESTLLTRDRT